ncbi:hypothetical protein ABTH93_20315 [Acinetobacter baumannii]
MPISPQARVTPRPWTCMMCVTALRLSCGLTTFGRAHPLAQRYPAGFLPAVF